MKNLKKVLAVMTAVASLCMSATAFAATGTVSSTQGLEGTYNWETGVLNITNNAKVVEGDVVTDKSNVKPNTETTVLVLNAGANETNVAEGDILYINQKNTGDNNASKDFADMGLKMPVDEDSTTTPKAAVTNLKDGTYKVKVGYYTVDGSFAIANADLVVSSGTTPGGKTITIKWGDVNGNGEVTDDDALTIIMRNLGGNTSGFGANGDFAGFEIGGTYTNKDSNLNFKWGDVNGNGEVTDDDALTIIMRNLGGNKSGFGANGEFAGFEIGTTYEFNQTKITE